MKLFIIFFGLGMKIVLVWSDIVGKVGGIVLSVLFVVEFEGFIVKDVIFVN